MGCGLAGDRRWAPPRCSPQARLLYEEREWTHRVPALPALRRRRLEQAWLLLGRAAPGPPTEGGGVGLGRKWRTRALLWFALQASGLRFHARGAQLSPRRVVLWLQQLPAPPPRALCGARVGRMPVAKKGQQEGRTRARLLGAVRDVTTGSKAGLAVISVTQWMLTRQTVDVFICIQMCAPFLQVLHGRPGGKARDPPTEQGSGPSARLPNISTWGWRHFVFERRIYARKKIRT